MPYELEIIACSREDALAAARGGASRLEITVHLEQDGLTPPAGMVRRILEDVSIPARVMLRENPEYTLRDRSELETLLHKAREFAAMGVEGFVFGYVKNGELDLEAFEEITRAVMPLPVTAHNAIEKTADPLEALRLLDAFPCVDRALVKAGSTLEERIQQLREYERAISPKKDLVLGGGLLIGMLQPLANGTSVRIFHLGRAARTPESPDGTVDSVKVQVAVRALSDANQMVNPRRRDDLE